MNITNSVYNQYICTWDNGRTVTYGTNDDPKKRQEVLSYSNCLSEFDHESNAPNYKFFYSETLQSFLFECDRKRVEFIGRPTGFSYIYQYEFNEMHHSDLFQELGKALAPASFTEFYPPEDFPEKKKALTPIPYSPNCLKQSTDCQQAVAYFIYQLFFGFPKGNTIRIVCECDRNNEWEFLFRVIIIQLLVLAPCSLYKELTFSMSNSITPKKGNIFIIPKSKMIQNNSTSYIYVTSVGLQSVRLQLINKDNLPSLYWAKCFSLAGILMNPNNQPEQNYNQYRQVITDFHNTLINEQDRDRVLYKDIITEPSVYISADKSEMCVLLCRLSVYHTSWFEAQKYSDAIVYFLNLVGAEINDNVVCAIVNMADRMESSNEIKQILIGIFSSLNSDQEWFHPLFRKLFEKNEQAAERINKKADKPIISGIKMKDIIPIDEFAKMYEEKSLWYKDRNRLGIIQNSIIAYVRGIKSQEDIEKLDEALQMCKRDHPSCYMTVMRHIAKTLNEQFELYYSQNKLNLFCKLLLIDSFRCDILSDKKLWKNLVSVCKMHSSISNENKDAVREFGKKLSVPEKKINELLSKKTKTQNTPQNNTTVNSAQKQSNNKKQGGLLHRFGEVLAWVLSFFARSLLFIFVIVVLLLYLLLFIKILGC